MNTQTENKAIELFKTGLTKTEIKNMALNAIDNLLEEGNPLQVAEALSAMESFIKEVKDSDTFKNYVRDEIAKNPKGFVSPSGAKIELAETGAKYDYSNCGDVEWEMLDSQVSSLKNSLSDREKFLKTVPLSGLDIITSDGEAIKIYPPSKMSTSSYKITLAK